MSDEQEMLAFTEPYWHYAGRHSPFYKRTHFEFRDKVRKFVEEELAPNTDKWLKEGRGYPRELHQRAYELGIHGAIYPKEYGGTPPENFDAFHEMILWQELPRAGAGGVLGQMSINSMALPPIINHGSKYLKDKVVKDVAGSDVAGIRTEARREGDVYVVNGQKKWITGGLMGDFFTCAVRTGGKGMAGISLLLLERDMPGITIRKMETQFDNTHNTTFVELEDVTVPARNLIGKEGHGFSYITSNFNHERSLIAQGACAMARMCFSEALHESLGRKTFGKRLFDHQIIRFKLAEMARQIEALHDNCERVTYQFACGVADRDLGAECALLKVHASKTFEYCAREAVQIFGGSGIVREGRGKLVERLYREVRASAIPGGSEEILGELAIKIAGKGPLPRAKM